MIKEKPKNQKNYEMSPFQSFSKQINISKNDDYKFTNKKTIIHQETIEFTFKKKLINDDSNEQNNNLGIYSKNDVNIITSGHFAKEKETSSKKKKNFISDEATYLIKSLFNDFHEIENNNEKQINYFNAYHNTITEPNNNENFNINYKNNKISNIYYYINNNVNKEKYKNASPFGNKENISYSQRLNNKNIFTKLETKKSKEKIIKTSNSNNNNNIIKKKNLITVNNKNLQKLTYCNTLATKEINHKFNNYNKTSYPIYNFDCTTSFISNSNPVNKIVPNKKIYLKRKKIITNNGKSLISSSKEEKIKNLKSNQNSNNSSTSNIINKNKNRIINNQLKNNRISYEKKNEKGKEIYVCNTVENKENLSNNISIQNSTNFNKKKFLNLFSSQEHNNINQKMKQNLKSNIILKKSLPFQIIKCKSKSNNKTPNQNQHQKSFQENSSFNKSHSYNKCLKSRADLFKNKQKINDNYSINSERNIKKNNIFSTFLSYLNNNKCFANNTLRKKTNNQNNIFYNYNHCTSINDDRQLINRTFNNNINVNNSFIKHNQNQNPFLKKKNNKIITNKKRLITLNQILDLNKGQNK